jgi:hypothetical protein
VADETVLTDMVSHQLSPWTRDHAPDFGSMTQAFRRTPAHLERDVKLVQAARWPDSDDSTRAAIDSAMAARADLGSLRR